jgi:hypothetical protein
MLFEVVLRRLVQMLFGMSKVRVGNVRVVCGPEMIARLMVLRSFRMMVSRLGMVVGCLRVMMDCLFRHWGISISARRLSSQSASMHGIICALKPVMCYRKFNKE